MALTVDYTTAAPWLITIPKSDLTLDTGTQYILTVDVFWALLRDFTDNQNTMARPKLYSRIPATSSTPSITTIDLASYQLQFEDGLYSVNITEGNTNIREAEVKNQVSVNTNNTTGFIDPSYLQYSTFNGGVTIDVINGISGSDYPVGTPAVPVNNLTDMQTIIAARGFDKVFIKGNLTISSGTFSQGVKFIGQSPAVSVVTLEDLANVNNCEFIDCFVQGVADDNNIIRECIVGDVTSFDGFFDRCAINSNITLGGATQTTLVDCFSNVAGSGTPSLMIGSGSALAIRGYAGGLELKDKTGTDGCSIDLNSGHINIANTCTAGTITVRGLGKISDFSNGTTVNTNDLLSGDRLNDIAVGIEELHPHTAGFGDVYYVDPDNGSDANVGHDRFRPWQSLNYAISQATANNGDVIYIVSSAGLSKSYVREFVVVNKAGLSIRGANKEVHIHPQTTGTDSMTVTADYTSLINITIETHMGGADNALTATNANYLHLDNCTIKNASQDNIDISGCDEFELVNSFVGYSGRYGLKIHDAHDALIDKCHIDTSGSDNIHITATASGTTHEVIVHDTIIHEAGGWGVNIGAGCETVQLHQDCSYILNVLGDVNDNGLTTYDVGNMGGTVKDDLLTTNNFIALS